MNDGKKKQYHKKCSHQNCEKQARTGGKCCTHSPHIKCDVDGCELLVYSKGKCRKHNDKPYHKKCSHQNCEKKAAKGGKCCAPSLPIKCDVDGCELLVYSKGKCRKHNGVPYHKKCNEYNCENNARTAGKCYEHSPHIKYDVEDCERLVYSKGKCRFHNGIPHHKTCIQPGCDSYKHVGDFCAKHADFTLVEYAKKIRSSCKHNDKRDKRDTTNMVTVDDIVETCIHQNNKCTFCNRDLVYYTNPTKKNMSVDRINNDGCHTKNNIHITCEFCNYARTASKLEDYTMFMGVFKYNKYPNFSNEEIDIDWSAKVSKKIRQRHKELLQTYNLDETQYPCITEEFIIKRLKSQRNLSHYSGLPIFNAKKKLYPFKGSIDRIDNTKPYTEDNCVIVCLAENLGRGALLVEDYKELIKEIRATK